MSKMPDFLIIGAARCGTSSLFKTLSLHPLINGPNIGGNGKEVHFFDKTAKWRRGPEWYEGLFEKKRGGSLNFEATPNYLYHPQAPERAVLTLRDARFIVMLRDPVFRAWSHYSYWRHKCGWKQGILFDPKHVVIDKGVYAPQVQRWFRFFDPGKFLFILSERFFSKPEEVAAEVFAWLGLPEFRLKKAVYYDPKNEWRKGPGFRPPDTMPKGIRRRLETFYQPHNDEVKALLGPPFGW